MMSQVLEVCNSGGRVLGIGNVCKGYMLVSFRVKVLFSLQTVVEKLKTLCPYVFSHAVLFEGRTHTRRYCTYIWGGRRVQRLWWGVRGLLEAAVVLFRKVREDMPTLPDVSGYDQWRR